MPRNPFREVGLGGMHPEFSSLALQENVLCLPRDAGPFVDRPPVPPHPHPETSREILWRTSPATRVASASLPQGIQVFAGPRPSCSIRGPPAPSSAGPSKKETGRQVAAGPPARSRRGQENIPWRGTTDDNREGKGRMRTPTWGAAECTPIRGGPQANVRRREHPPRRKNSPSSPSLSPLFGRARRNPSGDPRRRLSAKATFNNGTNKRGLSARAGAIDRLLLATAAGTGGSQGPTDRASRLPFPLLPPGLAPRGPAARARARAQRSPPLTGHAQRGGGTLPQLGGGGAGRSRQERNTAPPRGRRTPPPRGRAGERSLLRPCALAVATVATAHSGRGGGWGSGTPRLPLGSLEGFLTEGAPSLTRASLLQAHGGAPRAAQALSRAGGVCGTAKPTTHTGGVCTARAGGARPAPQGPSSVSLHDEGNRDGRPPPSLTVSTPREPTHGTHSPPRRGPEEDTGLRETTPPLGLRHLRDNLERSRGTTEEQPRGTLTHPRGARERGSGTALPTAGEAKQEHLLCQEDQRAPAMTPPGGGGGQEAKVRARDRTQPLPSSPSPTGRQGGKDGRGVPRTDREERARPPGTPVPRPALLRLGPGEHDHTTSITARAVANDPQEERLTRGTEPTGAGSSQPPQGARSGEAHRARHLGAGAQAQAGGSSGKGRIGRQPAVRRAQSPACIQRPKVLSGTPQTEKTVYRPVRVSERGFGFDGQKKKRRKNRRRGAPNETSGPGPGTAPGSQTVLDAAPRTARAGPHLLTGIQGVGAGVRSIHVCGPLGTLTKEKHVCRETPRATGPHGGGVGVGVEGVDRTRARAGRPAGRPASPGHPSRLRRAGPHLRSGAEGEANAPEGEANAPEGGPGGGRTAES
ncbi:collagen alpha-1(I) chain-like [Moschus berezovskii]|uniref:collagen alpha-1(I) chain-like n=1 Tax=Moschus berezovskii TaxID=68408 RepID=UPI0024449E3E|nr:collagen alpha-1(I) chain-like [Moschus berezovskii]